MNQNQRWQEGQQRDTHEDRRHEAQERSGQSGGSEEAYRYSSSERDDPGRREGSQRLPQGGSGSTGQGYAGGGYGSEPPYGAQGNFGAPSPGQSRYPGSEGFGGGSESRWQQGYGQYGAQRGQQDRSSSGQYGSQGDYGLRTGFGQSGWQGGLGSAGSGIGQTGARERGQFGAGQPGWQQDYQAGFGQERYGQERYGHERYGQERYGQQDQHRVGQQSGFGQQAQRGKGPKGYKRSDERIKEDVCERLSSEPMMDASDVDIEVREGVVKLSGSVQSRHLKHRIEDLAESLSGVKDVENRISVTRAESPEQSSTIGSSGGAGFR